MSLFPAYDFDTQFSNDTAKTDSWLRNESYAPVGEKISVEKVENLIQLDDDVEVVDLSSSSSDVQLVKREKRRKKVHKERKKKKKQRKSEREFSSNSATASAKVESIFLQPNRILSTNVQCYVIDCRKDVENLHFESTYARQRAVIAKKRRHCLGASAKLNEFLGHVHDKITDDTNWRYFSKKSKLPAKPRPLKKLDAPANANVDFLPIVQEYLEIDGEKLVFDPKIQMYRPLSYSTAQKSDDVIAQKLDLGQFFSDNKQFNKMLAENPHDIGVWLKFLKHQDEHVERPTVEKIGGNFLLERKMSILEKAISFNPQSLELKMLQIDLGVDLGWDRGKIDEFWQNLEFRHVNNLEMWQKRLTTNHFEFRQFSVRKKAAIFQNCLQKLRAVMSRRLVTHPAMPDTERFFVWVLTKSVELWHNAGHTEKAVAICQALLEFNFRPPLKINNLSLEERLKFFETFWDSGAPRIGEPGSKGWAAFFDDNSNMAASCEAKFLDQQILDQREKEILNDFSKNEQKCWLSIEKLRCESHFTPCNLIGQEPDDPERVILFEDIEIYLYLIGDELNRSFLIVQLLSIFGFEFPALFSSNDLNFEASSFTRAYEYFGRLPTLNEPQCKEANAFVQNVLDANDLQLCPPRGGCKTFLTFCQIFDRGAKLSRDVSKPVEEKSKLLREFCKRILAMPQNRSNTLLYVAYAKALCKLGNVDEAIGILMTDMWSCTNWKSDECGVNELIAHLYCVNCYVEICVTKKNSELQLERMREMLCNIIEGSAFIEISTCNQKFKDFHAKLKQNFSLHSETFYEFWLGDAFTLFTRIFAVFAFLTYLPFDCNDILGEARKFLLEKKSTTDISAQDGDRSDFLRLDRQREFLWECELQLDALNHTINRAPTLLYSRRLSEALTDFPANYRFLKRFCDLHASGYSMFKLRRFFNEKTGDFSKHCIAMRHLASIYANFAVFLKYRDADECAAYGFGSVRQILQKSTEICDENALFWRLYFKLESEQSGDKKLLQKIFYQGIRRCPDSKLFYTDVVGVSDTPEETARLMDLMVEKELRVRLPWEEFDLLWRNERKVRLFSKAGASPDTCDEHENSGDEGVC